MTGSPYSSAGLLLVGHGTREPEGIAQFHKLARQIREQLSPTPVAECFLEFAQPEPALAIESLVAQGAKRVVLQGVLLFAAGHLLEDLPRIAIDAASRHPGVRFDVARHLGCHEALVELSRRRFLEALNGPSPATRDLGGPAASDFVIQTGSAPLDEVLLVLVGRGSNNPAANAEMAQFARLRYESLPVGWCELCFTGMAEPSMARGLEVAARIGMPTVVVQPHLLFAGRLMERIRAEVDTARQRFPAQRWLIAEPLGPDALVVDAVAERFRETLG